MIELRQIPIYRALSRSNLILGCDRELLLLSGLIAATLIFVAATVISALVGIIVWFVVFALLRKMGKADPQMRDIYRQHIRYRAYYAPRATPFARGARWERKTARVN